MHLHIRHAIHRHSIFCIVPPHVLHEIARRGNAAQRNAALNTLAIDGTMRTQRLTFQLIATAARPVVTGAPPQVHRTIFTADHAQAQPGRLLRSEGQGPVGDPAVDEAYDGLGHTFDFYLQNYQRNSIDDMGLHLTGTVHFATRFNNAFWDVRQMVFGDGDPAIFNRFTCSWDVFAHYLPTGGTGAEHNLQDMRQQAYLT